jgi:acyl carrier protein
MNSIDEKVSNIVISQLSIDSASITPTTSFEEVGAGIFDMAQLIVSVEEAFNIEVTDEDADRLLTVGDLIAYVKRKQAGPSCRSDGPAK